MTGHVEAKALLEATILPIWRDAVKININNSTYTWPTGEQLRLGFFGDMSDYQTWIGQSWPWIGWEELTQFPDDKFYKQMLATNRSDYPGLPVMVRATTNPGGPGHEWVRCRFDPPPEPKYGYIVGHRIEPPNNEPTRRAICSTLEENQRFLLATPNYKAPSPLLPSTRVSLRHGQQGRGTCKPVASSKARGTHRANTSSSMRYQPSASRRRGRSFAVSIGARLTRAACCG